MADRRYQPGKRRTPSQRGTGRMSDHRFAWMKSAIGDLVIMRYLQDDPDESEEVQPGPTVRLFIPRPGGRPVSLNITALTEQELDTLEELFKLLIFTARPFVRQYDEEAKRAYEKGDDSYARSYRVDAQLIVREGAGKQHREGVHNGPEDAPTGDEPGVDSDGATGGRGPAVAEREAPDPEPAYDWPTPDQPTGF